jgi:cytochrome c-type biogenesis protein CcmH
VRALLLLLVLVAPALAVEPNERLADPALEARARALSQGLRCLVCQNESIDESQADLAHDVRVMLRERIRAGDSDAQAVAYIVARYGDFVLLQPPVKRSTWVLWFGPPAALALGAAGLALAVRRRRAASAPLSAEEERALAALMERDL